MHWIARVFVTAAVRRVAALLVVAVLAFFGVGQAHAMDQGEAYAAAVASLSTAGARCKLVNAAYTVGATDIIDNGVSRVTSKVQCLMHNGNPYGWENIAFFDYTSKCSSRPSQTTPFLPVTGSTRCNRGCVITFAQNVDETSIASPTGAVCSDQEFKENCPEGSYYNGYMGVCEPVQKSCPEGQEERDGQCHPKNQCPSGMVAVQGTTPGAVQQGSLYCKPAKEECPPGNVTSPGGQCLPGDGQCAAGEARRDNGTCGKDSDGDGVADEDDNDPNNDPEKDSASGGDSCDAPPSCSGNAISCMQVKIQWRIDCNTRRAKNISGGTCEAVPVCTGKGCDAMEYAQLMQQWRATCALEKLAKKGDGGPGDEEGCAQGDANCNGVPDAIEGSGDPTGVGDSEGDVDGAKKFGIGVNPGMLNQEAIFGTGSCPQPPSFQLMGVTIDGGEFPYWCQAMAILRALILLFGAFTALKILMGWGL